MGILHLCEHNMAKPCQTPRRRHPASGYVQGINDLATPFLAVSIRTGIV
jgi:hypothetical protein